MDLDSNFDEFLFLQFLILDAFHINNRSEFTY